MQDQIGVASRDLDFLVRRQLGGEDLLGKGTRKWTKDGLEVADRVLEDADPVVQALEDPFLDRALQKEGVDTDLVPLLTYRSIRPMLLVR